MKALIIGMALNVIVAVVPTPASAQGSRDADGRQQVGCFRGRPLPACKSFWIFEMQGSSPVAQTSRTIRTYFDATRTGSPQEFEYDATAFTSVVEWNLGHMVNLGDKYALGGVVTVGSGNGDGLAGLKARVRRWLSSDLSVEAEAGALWSSPDGGIRSNVVGGTAALRFNVRDQGAFFLRWDVLPLPEESSFNGYLDPGGTQSGLSVGVSAGSVPALIGTGALGVTMAILLAMYVRYD
jgi:hypothetical protein